MQSDSVENIFARAWSLLVRNPVIVVPGLLVGIASGLVQASIGPHATGADVTEPGGPVALGIGLSWTANAAISLAVSVLAFLITQTYTTGMAGAAWQRGITTLRDGSASFREDAGRLLSAMLLIAVVGIVLAVLTFGLGWFVLLFFAIYMVPAVVLDNYRAVPAFRLSARIATRRLLTTIMIVIMLLAIGLVVALLTLPLAVLPFAGPIILAVVSQAVTAYTTLVMSENTLLLAARRTSRPQGLLSNLSSEEARPCRSSFASPSLSLDSV